MRQVVLYSAMSLDGYIATPNGQVDWLSEAGDYGFEEFYKGVDTLLMGHNTYRRSLELAQEYPYFGKQGFVFTRKEGLAPEPGVHFIWQGIPEFVRQLKRMPGQDIWLVGGGQTNALLLNAGLVDQVRLAIHPLILGSGIALFNGTTWRTQLELERHTLHPDGMACLDYRVRKG